MKIRLIAGPIPDYSNIAEQVVDGAIAEDKVIPDINSHELLAEIVYLLKTRDIEYDLVRYEGEREILYSPLEIEQVIKHSTEFRNIG